MIFYNAKISDIVELTLRPAQPLWYERLSATKGWQGTRGGVHLCYCVADIRWLAMIAPTVTAIEVAAAAAAGASTVLARFPASLSERKCNFKSH